MGNLSNLTYLDLHTNQLNSSIPSQLGNLSNLTYLDLHTNQLSGSIPSQLGNLSNLTYLDLHTNQLNSSIPSQLGNLSNLANLYLYTNQLNGNIPPELSNLSNLINLKFNSNQLSGSIPPELGNLSNLLQLDFADNQLSGSIPPELGNLTELRWLTLNHNQLTGLPPTELKNLVNLTPPDVDLGYNHLTTTGLDSALDAFLLQKDPDWKLTQTAPPIPASLTSIYPDNAVANAGQMPLIIEGANLQAPVTAKIGNVTLTDVTLGDGTIHAVVPVASLAQGSHDVTITSNGQTITLPNAFTVKPPVAETQFRVMVYLACDNDLQPECELTFDNLEAAMAHNPNLRIVVFWDGITQGDSAYYLIQPDVRPGGRLTNYSDAKGNKVSLGEADTASVGTLVQFSAWAQAQYPGKHKLLSLWGHGGGWAPDLVPDQARGTSTRKPGGMLWDFHGGSFESAVRKSSLSTAGLAKALRWITDAYPLDVLYLDACLMGTLEVVAAVSPYSDYVIAHENLTWAFPLYKEYLKDVTAETTPADFAKHVADTHQTAWNQANYSYPTQVGVIETSAIAQHVLPAWNSLSMELLRIMPTHRAQIEKALAATARTSPISDGGLQTAPLDNPMNGSLIDVYDFATQLRAQPEISDRIKQTAAQVQNAMTTAIILNARQSGHPWNSPKEWWDLERLHGLSVYFPAIDEWKRPSYGVETLPVFAEATAWDDVVQAWYTGQVAPAPIESCTDCLPKPQRTAIYVDTPESNPQVGDVVFIDVNIGGVATEDDIVGIQLDTVSDDLSILAPATNASPKPGKLTPGKSMRHHAKTNKGWQWMMNVPKDVTDVVAGTGVVASFPFVARGNGCTQVLINNSRMVSRGITRLGHQVRVARVCVGNTPPVSSRWNQHHWIGLVTGSAERIERGIGRAHRSNQPLCNDHKQ